MFNSGYKKEAMENLKEEGKKYDLITKETINSIEEVHREKTQGFELVKTIEKYINSLANTPKELISTIEKISLNLKSYNQEINEIEKKYENINLKSGTVAGVGVATGTAVAAFGPTAALAIATTFGTASTGTAIASLSGAAASSAALAWLGGGALAAGGGGMAAGDVLLGLAGPVGWAIGGTALIAGGVWANKKNKKAGQKAEAQIYEIKKEIIKFNKVKKEIFGLKKQLNSLITLVNSDMNSTTKNKIKDYSKATKEEKQLLGNLVNDTNALSVKINSKLRMVF